MRKANPQSQYRRFGLRRFVTRGGNPFRQQVLEGARRIREGIDPKPKTLGDFAGVEGVIPELDYAIIRAVFPELRSRDHEIRSRAWLKFLNSPAGADYRVSRKVIGGKPCRSTTAR